jgi:ribosomal protein S12 methylthiotransferase
MSLKKLTPRMHLVSLGCPKNRVDSEVMLGVAEGAGYTHTQSPEEADVIVINTCGFIESAKQESIETILELSRYKQEGRCQKLVVTGCLSQRYGTELAAEMPEVDHFLGSSDMLKLGKVLEGSAPRLYVGNPADWVMGIGDPRRLSTRGASAYVKIAEGCSRQCSFCVIPGLRGKQRSRSIEDVVQEVQKLASAGVLEVNLVSQDTVSYGRDRNSKSELGELVRRIAETPELRWVRLFYLYPEKLSDEIVELIAAHEKVLPYIDMPLQHAADGMLRRMRRGHGGERLRQFVRTVRERLPDVVFRTAFIVGHPGETDAEFDELCEFVEWAKFDRVGVFHYSDEPTSHSYTLEGKVDPEVAQERAQRLMDLQRSISLAKNEALVGKELEVLIEGPSEESELVMQGRWRGQAPDIDGQVYISGGPVYPGQMVKGIVEQASEYDLTVDVGELPDLAPEALKVSGAMLHHRQSDGRVMLRTV